MFLVSARDMRTTLPRRLWSPFLLLLLSFLVLFLLPPVSSIKPPINNSIEMSNINDRLKELDIALKDPPAPKGNYCLAVRTGNPLHLSGHLPQKQDGRSIWTGKVGTDLTVEEGYESAKCCAIQLLATLSQFLQGDWSRVVRVVKLVGFVQCADSFHQQPAVINGASDLFVKVFGDQVGMHARSAVGTNALPLNIATEVECIVEIKD
ncbi:Endoribonuclease L-PSP [Seminavis robusta]|uniref:Endoribonuclease L-PSP n=1 Tax=Seminavis robusta TaxID=568900 RepID=A0A9N8DXD7_9STRA|nr:Endoribonuclease L-PSP [Seminavis robusta]|eukprot:Sro344_g122290.1 Endoribonuclease L-PSP (207) ;mRNA; f:56838-57458